MLHGGTRGSAHRITVQQHAFRPDGRICLIEIGPRRVRAPSAHRI